MHPDAYRIRLPALRARRTAFAGLVAVTAGAGVWMMVRIVGAGGFTPLEFAILALFAPTFTWIVIPFWTAVTGFGLRVAGLDPLTLRRHRGGPRPLTRRRVRPLAPGAWEPGSSTSESTTALLVPVYNEDPGMLEARLSAMARSLESSSASDRFDIHILSDTNRTDVARGEEAAWARLQGTHPGVTFCYRRRTENRGRKAGNISEFVDRRGSDYPFMVVLDADSLMSAETLLHLVRRMEAHPRAALIQTLPLPVRQETLMGRILQFAAWVYAPILATGQAFWQGDAANYWGHNAIIRVKPFADHARLPVLPGREPWGGEILSHDFVEAALLRRAGWEVLLDAAAPGSFEELPGNLVDYARRDRRWAQGSIQHLRLLGWPGLHLLNRLHFLLGAMGYVSSFLWLLILLAGTVYVFLPGARGAPVQLRVPLPPEGLSLLAVTAAILFVPKVLGLTEALARPGRFGGRIRLLVSAFLETVFSVLLAPVMMVYHSRFVADIVRGRSVGWGTQVRDGVTLPWASVTRATALPTLLGAVWAGATLWVSPAFLLWMSPIFAGLLLAPLLLRWTSSPSAGGALRRWGLLLAPCEIRPAPVLSSLARSTHHDFSPVGTISELQSHGDLDADTGVPERLAHSDEGASQSRGEHMYNAERGLFDLRRGRPLLVTDETARPGGAHALVASVEGLAEARLRLLEEMADAAPRLVITRHRAAAMGLAAAQADGAGEEMDISLAPWRSHTVTLCLDRDIGMATVLQLSAGRTGPWAGSPPSLCRQLDAEAAGLELAHLGQLLPALVSVPVSKPISPALREALGRREILTVEASEIRDFIRASKSEVVRVSDAPVPLSEAEDSRFVLFREACGLGEHVAILVGSEEDWPDPLPVRFHSACLTGDLFGSLRCDCGEQLRMSMEYFASRGGGVLLYLAQEGRGIGLGNKFRAYTLQETGLDTIDADSTLGFGADERRYDVAVRILHHLGIGRIELLTNNPEKVDAARAAGVEVVSRRPLHGQLNRHNLPYVRAKVDRAGHWLHGMLRQGVAGD
jgi:membrane glycosyltransferase